MEGAEFSRRHLNLAFTDNFERQVEVESGDGATVIAFRAEVQITGQDGYRRIKSLGLAIGVWKSGCQNGFAFVFQKLGRVELCINGVCDSEGVLMGWLLCV